MKKLTKDWAYVSVYLGALAALAAVLGDFGARERTLLLSLTFIMLHFYEEFVFPGGFAWCGLKVEMHITDTDARTWPLNRVNAMFGNWWFALAVYVLPLLLPEVKALTLAAVLFAFAEVLMHAVMFNLALRDWYNPGLFTAVFGLLPLSLHYLLSVRGQGLYGGKEIALALLWIVVNYWIAFRSPIYQRLGALGDDYAFSEEEVWRARRWIEKNR